MRFATQAVTAAAAVGVAVAASSAFTAGNTVEVSSVGQAASVSTGYTISGVDYDLKALGADADKIDKVHFAVAPVAPQTDHARTVRARLTSGGSYVECTTSGVTRVWACDVSAANVSASAALTLDVVAAG